ncbi:MAG: glucosaminidase domain-containing protein [Ignavibacteria bacterium]|nr:glucosaminidase domain-containing protein [Ignavibacteria bacterium]
MKKRLIALILTLTLYASLYAPEYRSVPIFPGEIIYHIRPDELYRMLFIYKIKHPEIVWKQAMLETGWIKSPISKEGKNLFGMKYNNRGFCSGEKYGHASYDTYYHSLADYKAWQDNYYKGGDYYEFLIRIGYAEDNNYIEKLKQIKY